MSAYFEQGKDLTKAETLIEVGTAAGLEGNKISSLLNSEEGLKEVIQNQQINYQRGISGVPFYIVNGKYGISGAQPSDVFVKVLSEIGSTVELEGEACDVDSKEC
jgi:Predicted dithiol-disulfide isomerase involved in polyketide biosynthesis